MILSQSLRTWSTSIFLSSIPFNFLIFTLHQPTAAADLKMKPFASKPMEEGPKKKSKLQPSAPTSRLAISVRLAFFPLRPWRRVRRRIPNYSPRLQHLDRDEEAQWEQSAWAWWEKGQGIDTASNNKVVAAEDSGKKADSKKLILPSLQHSNLLVGYLISLVPSSLAI